MSASVRHAESWCILEKPNQLPKVKPRKKRKRRSKSSLPKKPPQNLPPPVNVSAAEPASAAPSPSLSDKIGSLFGSPGPRHNRLQFRAVHSRRMEVVSPSARNPNGC